MPSVSWWRVALLTSSLRRVLILRLIVPFWLGWFIGRYRSLVTRGRRVPRLLRVWWFKRDLLGLGIRVLSIVLWRRLGGIGRRRRILSTWSRLEKRALAKAKESKGAITDILGRILVSSSVPVVAGSMMLMLLGLRCSADASMHRSGTLRNGTTVLIVGRWGRIIHAIVVLLSCHFENLMKTIL